MCLCSNYFVSLIWRIGWFTTWRESFLWSALTCLMSCISRLHKIQLNRWYVIIQIMFYLFYLLNLIVWQCIHFLCIDPIYIYIVWANFALCTNCGQGRARPNIQSEGKRVSEDVQPRNGQNCHPRRGGAWWWGIGPCPRTKVTSGLLSEVSGEIVNHSE